MFVCTISFTSMQITARYGTNALIYLTNLLSVLKMIGLFPNKEMNPSTVLVTGWYKRCLNDSKWITKMFEYRSGSDFSPTTYICWANEDVTFPRRF